jgi:hypothetical protein
MNARFSRFAAAHALPVVTSILTVVSAIPVLAADEIHYTMTSPTAVTFDWRGAGRTLRYGLTTSYGLTATGQAPSILPRSSTGPYWEARLSALQAGKTYHYSLDGGPDHTFQALPAAGASFTVFAEGDIGSSLYPSMAGTQALIPPFKPSFVLGLGDYAYSIDHGIAAIDQHFNDVMVWSQDAAYMPIWGNHDWSDSTEDLREYKGRFDLPNPQTSPGSPAISCCGEDWYWFDAGNTRFIAYPEPFTGAWAAWFTAAKTLMDQAQAISSIHWIVTFGHRAAYSTGSHAGLATIRGYLDTLGVHHSKYVLNLNGHSHDYERTTPQFGVTHVTIGTGGSTLEMASGTCPWAGGCPPPAWSVDRAFHHGVLRLAFDASGIRGDMLCGAASSHDDTTCAPGSLWDSFTITGQVATGAPPSRPGTLALDMVRPDPARSVFAVQYTLADDREVRLELLDVAGRSVRRFALNPAGEGRHEVELSVPQGFRPGVYWLRMTQSGRTAIRSVVLLP